MSQNKEEKEVKSGLDYCRFMDSRIENVRKKLMKNKHSSNMIVVLDAFGNAALGGETSCSIPRTRMSKEEEAYLESYGFRRTGIFGGTLNWEKMYDYKQNNNNGNNNGNKNHDGENDNIMNFVGTSMISPAFL